MAARAYNEPYADVAAPEEDAMLECKQCGVRNELRQTFCVVCGARVRDEAIDAESGHIDYVLTEIPRWEQWGWIYPAMAERLSKHYRARQQSLRNPTTALPPPPTVPLGAIQPEFALPHRQVDPPTPVHSGPEYMDSGPPWIAEFLEAHWLKLLA